MRAMVLAKTQSLPQFVEIHQRNLGADFLRPVVASRLPLDRLALRLVHHLGVTAPEFEVASDKENGV